MTNEEFEAMRNERTEELAWALIRNNTRITNIVRNAYERGFADGIDQQKKRQQIKVLIGGKQVYPEQEAEDEQV